MNNETKEERRIRQNKAWNKMVREISYRDSGEVFRRNIFWKIQSRVEIIS